MKWIKAALVGLVGSLVMFILIQLALRVGMAPFNAPPSAVFLISVKDMLGIPPVPWALVLHFAHGLIWSVILVALARHGANLWKGLGLGVFLWLVMMVVWSPVIGWGFFGIGGSPEGIAEDSPLYLAPGPKYIVATLILHLVYGGLVGWLDGLWIRGSGRGQTEKTPTIEKAGEAQVEGEASSLHEKQAAGHGNATGQ